MNKTVLPTLTMTNENQQRHLTSLAVETISDFEPESLKTVKDVQQFLAERVYPLLPGKDVVLVPRGIVDRNVFPFHKMNAFGQNDAGPVRFHGHIVSSFVPSNINSTPTLVAPDADVLRALHTVLLRTEEGRNLYNAIRVDEKTLQLGENLRQQLSILFNAPQLYGHEALVRLTLKTYGQLFNQVALSNQNAFYEHSRSVQKEVGKSALIMDWNANDIGTIGENVLHARSALEGNTRKEDEVLHLILQTHET